MLIRFHLDYFLNLLVPTTSERLVHPVLPISVLTITNVYFFIAFHIYCGSAAALLRPLVFIPDERGAPSGTCHSHSKEKGEKGWWKHTTALKVPSQNVSHVHGVVIHTPATGYQAKARIYSLIARKDL